MNLTQAIKQGLVIEIELDLYLTKDGRIFKYDRYYGPKHNKNMWIDEDGNPYKNFCDIYNH